jgi:IS30 family transposase
LRRKRCKRKRRLDDPTLSEWVEAKLLLYWSPEQIAGRLAYEQGSRVISFVTIYRAVHQGNLPGVSNDCLRRKGRKYSPSPNETRGRLHGHKTIRERPVSGRNRSYYGHWEGDTVRGALNKGCLATFVDRRSRYLLAGLMPDRKAATLNATMKACFSGYPKSLLRSFTVDHGNEFFSYRQVQSALQTAVYFADPYSAWQRGSNENTNGLLRQYFPKKFDFHAVTRADVNRVVDLLNHRPRKTLGFRPPAEVFPLKRLLHLL